MKKENILIFVIGVILGVLGYALFENFKGEKTQQPIQDSPSDAIIEVEKENNIKTEIIEGELTGFEDVHSVEIVTAEGPISCQVYEKDIISKLEELTEQKIKVEVKYNESTGVRIIQKVL